MAFIATFVAAAFISGVNPNLHTFNREGECGTGAVVPWAGSLWTMSYGPHSPAGSSDKLYEIRPDFSRIVRAESIGGTHANRLVHRESRQLFMGPYVIDERGGVRVMRPRSKDRSLNLYGRLTATTRHLFDPARKVYMATMEEGVYEVDVRTLAVKELFRDGNAQKGPLSGALLPGYHGKGAYVGQGRFVYANNGEYSPAAMKDPSTASGVLAEWNGRPGRESWRVVLRSQFTDVTSRGGIRGAADPARDPLWAVGWDCRSVVLMVLDGGKWHRFRLPKGSHSYDGAHGWNTEWPRIREIGEGDDYLMTMHGTFWHFPATMSARNSAGIRPRSNYLKVVGDFCRWGDKVVMGCDDTAKSEFLNRRGIKGGLAGPGQSNSNLWFVDPKDLDGFGPAIGRGAVWQEESVPAGAVSDAYLLAGYDRRTLYLTADAEFAFDVEVDERGDGSWRRVERLGASVAAGNALAVVPLDGEKGEWIRLVAKSSAKRVTAFFNYANHDKRAAKSDPIFAGIGGMTTQMGDCQAVVRCGAGDGNLKLQLLDVTCNSAGGYYEMGGDLKLNKVAERGSKQAAEMRRRCRVAPNGVITDGEGVTAEKASILVVDDNGARWRLPWSGGWASEGGKGHVGRTCREVCTERDLLNVGGTFYELPAENAGGFSKLRPVATHGNMFIHDYCTWRGLLVMTGMARFGRPANPRIVNGEGAGSTAAVWLGVVDDLWKYGKPRGHGGPWLNTPAKKGVPSDPYLMTGYDRKRVEIASAEGAGIALEIDVTGCGTWARLKSYKAGAEPVKDDLGHVRAYWVRAVADRDCTATVQFVYE
jgi:hypothetical protein